MVIVQWLAFVHSISTIRVQITPETIFWQEQNQAKRGRAIKRKNKNCSNFRRKKANLMFTVMMWPVQVDNTFQFVVVDSLPVQRSYLKRQRTLRGRLSRGCFHCRGSGETISLGPSKHDTVFFARAFTQYNLYRPNATISHCLYLSLTLTMIVSQMHRFSLSLLHNLYVYHLLSISIEIYRSHNFRIGSCSLSLVCSFLPVSALIHSPSTLSHSPRAFSDTLSHTNTFPTFLAYILYALTSGILGQWFAQPVSLV